MTQPPGPYQPGPPTNPWPAPDQPGQPVPTSQAPAPAPAPQSVPPAPAPYQQTVPPDPYPGVAPQYPPPYPGAAPPYPISAVPGGYPPYFQQPPAQRTGLVVTVIVLIAVVLLGGGGVIAAVLLNRNPDGPGGKPSADAAVQAFLKAVYVDQDMAKASPLVCAAARDTNKLTAKINEIKAEDKQYESPRYTWRTPKTESSAADRAVLSTTVTLATANVQRATLNLRLTAIKSTAWFVCDVQKA